VLIKWKPNPHLTRSIDESTSRAGKEKMHLFSSTTLQTDEVGTDFSTSQELQQASTSLHFDGFSHFFLLGVHHAYKLLSGSHISGSTILEKAAPHEKMERRRMQSEGLTESFRRISPMACSTLIIKIMWNDRAVFCGGGSIIEDP
jgi:hypothetical protein